MRWSQLGFGRTSSTSTAQATPRNLMGFKDGTRNIKVEERRRPRRLRLGRRRDRPAVDEGRQLPRRAPDPDAHRVVGHRLPRRPGERLRPVQDHRRAARPARSEFDPPDLSREEARRVGDPGRRAHPAGRAGVRTTVRRSCAAATPTPTASTRTPGLLDAGLFFIAYQKDPHKQFVPIQPPSARTTRSTSTSGTPAARSSPFRPAFPARGIGGAKSSSAELSRVRPGRAR